MPSRSEEYCKSQFDNWLRSTYSAAEIDWEYVSVGQQPPDFYLTLDGKKYAVEVAIVMRHPQVGDKRIPDAQIDHALRRFVLDVAIKCRKDGVLLGAYFVNFPQGVANFGKIKTRLETQIVNYVKQTQMMESCEAKQITINDQMICEIDKMHNEGAYIATIGLGYGGSETKIYKDFCPELKRELADKVRVLKKIKEPCILLLDDEFYLAGPNLWRACLLNITDNNIMERFHTVYVIGGGNNDFLLYSQETGLMERIDDRPPHLRTE
jgi:hypothetical protein